VALDVRRSWQLSDAAAVHHRHGGFVWGIRGLDGAAARGPWTELPHGHAGSAAAAGCDAPEQQADFAISQCAPASTPCKRYIVNRASNADQTAQIPWGGSEYDFNRFHSWNTNGDNTARNGKLVFFTLAEENLLEAEGQYRLGNFAAAAALINKTRTGNGKLPAITAFDATTPVPGDNACVPKVPTALQGPLVCGNMFEALKWEKRLETENTHWMAWFIDSRGWGDLPEGTPLFWAAPFSDLQVRLHPVYSVGGSSTYGKAAKGTYGW
jgi:hypothetical protein